MIWVQLAAAAKRCHDRNSSGWWQFLPFYIFWIMFRKGEDRDNKYGPYINLTKSINFVHIISWVSLVGVAIGTAALILVLSVFNGFEDLILKMYNSFDPHLKITSAEGKVFDSSNIIINNPEIEEKAYVLEERVLLKYQEKEFIATVKGVSSCYKNLTNFDSLLVEGDYIDAYENNNVTVVGRGVAYYLSMGLGTMFQQLQVFAPNRSAKTLLNPQTAFKQGSVLPVGVFSIQAEIDEQYIITPLIFIQNLAERDDKISAIELKLKDADQILKVQEQLKAQLGDKFVVKNRLEQQEFLYKILNTEKLAVFLILAFIMIIATFNIIGSLSMLMLDKKQDIKTLKSFGATKNDIRAIFFSKGMLTIIAGIFIGLAIGLLLAALQQAYGFISMGSGSFVVNAYPVVMKIADVFLVSVTVLVIGLLASWYPAKFLSRKLF
jgi:lipoprotein-releasing system permease protein